ncbi:MAG: MMPL family transporter [Thermoplasmatales archaeon]|nr:MMPL family transporter [Thermoplasmatales archaeon]
MLYEYLFKRPKTVVALFTLITIIISINGLRVAITPDIEVYMPSDQPSVKLLEEIRKEWPIDSLMIYINSTNITEISSLKEIYAVEKALNPKEGLEDGVFYTSSISSLLKSTNAYLPIFGKDEIPQSQLAVNFLLNFIPDEIKKMLISQDNKNGVIIVTTQKGIDVNSLLDERVYPITSSTTNTKFYPTGMLTLYAETINWIMERIYPISIFSLLFITIVLFSFHRDLKIVIISILPVLYCIGLTFGTMGLMPIKFAPTVIAVIPLLAAYGISYSLHVINHYLELIETKSEEESIKKMISTTGMATFLSAVTTVIGFASLLTSSMPPIANMGLAFFIGVVYCFIATIVLVPCLLLIFKPRKAMKVEFGRFANLTKYRKHIFLIILIISIISIVSLPNVETRNSVWEMMPEKMGSMQVMMEYSEKFNSGQSGVILIESKEEGLLEPSFLKKIDEMEKIINSGVVNVSVYSVVDVIKRLNSNKIPNTKEEVKDIVERMPEQYKVMMFNKNYSKSLMYVEMPVMSVEETKRVVATVNQIIKQINEDVKDYGEISNLAGLSAITVEINEMLMNQQFKFMFISLIAVYLTLLIIYRSFRYASFTVLPIVFLIFWQPILLFSFNIPLNVSTVTVASIAIGSGIDFACHITERVRDEVKSKSGLQAIKTALSKKTPSLVEATIALVGGGIPILLMEYKMISQFIILVLSMLVFACIASIFTLASFYSLRDGKLIEEWK